MVSNDLARVLFSSPLLSLGQKNQRFLSVSNVSSLVLWSSPPPTFGQTKQGCLMIPMALHGARAAPTSNPASHRSLSLDCVRCHSPPLTPASQVRCGFYHSLSWALPLSTPPSGLVHSESTWHTGHSAMPERGTQHVQVCLKEWLCLQVYIASDSSATRFPTVTIIKHYHQSSDINHD